MGIAAVEDPNVVIHGPAKIFVNTGLPATAARIAIDTDGAPTIAGSPVGVYLGMTRGGSTFTAGFDVVREEADELTSPYRMHTNNESALLEGEFLEFLDFDRTQYLISNGVFSSGTGYAQITAGGLLTFRAVPIVVTARTMADPTKFLVIQIYSAFNSAGIKLALTKKADAAIPFKFEGLAVAGRPAGDQLYSIWYQTP